MKRLVKALSELFYGLSKAASRFPLTVACLVSAASLVGYMIHLDREPELFIQKLMFTFLLGSFLGVAAQFAWERFKRLAGKRQLIYLLSAVLTAGYYLIIFPAPNISFEVTVRTFVAIFAMFCFFLWVPSCREKFDFNASALIHFKSAFTSVLYSAVLTAGCAAIIAAIDTLLFDINNDAYQYMMTIIWILFAPIYYLSLLPRFNSSEEEERRDALAASRFPQFLNILVSYIAIPLVTAYTMVLAAYFIKILLTLKWPSGQLGIMVLLYSAAGLIIYILASLLDNRWAELYKKIFPKVLIPVVIMQLISVVIRLNAYGFTESRYYVSLFGVFSLVCAVVLSIKPVTRNGMIAILAAGFAIVSVLPPVDAFTVSRVSQINRLEKMLTAENILVDGQIKPKADVSLTLRAETTSILNYLNSRHYTEYIQWLPKDFSPYNDMKSTFGFEPAYNTRDAEITNFYAHADMQQPIAISTFDVFMNISSYRGPKNTPAPVDFEIRGTKYQVSLERLSDHEVRAVVKNANGEELIGTGLYDFTQTVSQDVSEAKGLFPLEKMTFDTVKGSYKLRIIFQNLNITYGDQPESGVDYDLVVMFKAAQ